MKYNVAEAFFPPLNIKGSPKCTLSTINTVPKNTLDKYFEDEDQKIAWLTRKRRELPILSSRNLGNPFCYSEEQLYRKRNHLYKDFGIPLEGKLRPEIVKLLFHEVEHVLAKPGLVRFDDGTINYQEPAILFGFGTDSPAFDTDSSYTLQEDSYDEFLETHNLGLHPDQRKQCMYQQELIETKQKQKRAEDSLFYSTLPEDARVSNKQLREAKEIKFKLQRDPEYQLTKQQTDLLTRVNKHEQYLKAWKEEIIYNF